MIIFLSSKRNERVHPVRINHAVFKANLAVAPFQTYNSTRLVSHSWHAVKVCPLQFEPLCAYFNFLIKRLKGEYEGEYERP